MHLLRFLALSTSNLVEARYTKLNATYMRISFEKNFLLFQLLTIFMLCVVVDCFGAVGARIVRSSLFSFQRKHLAKGAIHLECRTSENDAQKKLIFKLWLGLKLSCLNCL